MKKLSLLFVVVLCSLVACKHEDVVPANPGAGPGTGGTGTTGGTTGTGVNPADTALCFERDVLPIFIANCARSGCHDAVTAQDGYVFTSYQTITRKKFKAGDLGDTELWEKINESPGSSDIMPPPPNPALTTAQKGIIKDWILRGAPNTGGCSAGCDSTKYTFSGTILPLTQQYCRGCHSTVSPSSGIALDNYAGVQAVALNGRLLGAIKHMPGFSQMPKGGAQLSACQIRQVENWIAAGAQNN